MTDNNKISNFITSAPGFQYSINLKYDLLSKKKIENYIPTTSSLEIIEEVLLSINSNSNDRSRILIGPYGKGKSHLVLMIISLLYYKDEKLFSNLLSKIKEYDKKLYNLVQEILEDNKKMLPVIVSGNSLNLKQSLLNSLKEALENHGLDSVMPTTYFNSALETIKMWKSSYKDTYDKLCENIDMSIEDFKKELNNYNEEVYNMFTDIYPILTSGGEFNPMQGIDVVDLYSNVTESIKKCGYKGIYIIYDEFSKYLEGSIDRQSSAEIKLLQDLAEKCNRSKNTQMHMMLISHKDINNYVDRLPKEKVDSWKAVGDRFKTIEINNLDIQTYEIMSNVILKDDNKWKKYKDANKEIFKNLVLETSKIGLFGNLGTDLENKVVYGCYPLHPISTYILPKISEKIAQNERTIFTFLSTNERNTLKYYLSNNEDEFPLLTPDYIFDYFEALFKKENYNSETYNIWRDTSNALKKVEDDDKLSKNIIKTIGLIYILNEFQKLPPTKEIIKTVYRNYSDKQVEEVVEYLLDHKIIYNLKSKGYLKFIDATDIDVNNLISNTIEVRKNVFSSKKILNENFYDNYVYPTRYNDENEIIRYFKVEFIDFKELLSTEDWNLKIEDKDGDGVIYSVLVNDNEELKRSSEIVKNIEYQRIIFILPKQPIRLNSLLKEYDAIKYLIGKNRYEGNDQLLDEELNVHLEDVENQLQSYLDIYIKPEKKAANYYYRGKRKRITRKSNLTRLISIICEKVYNDTPVIINELINKDKPTKVAIRHRQKVIDGLLRNKIEKNLGLKGYGQDVTIMRATLIVPGILKQNNKKAYLDNVNIPAKLKNVLDIIRDYCIKTSTEGSKTFSELYNILIKPKYSIGLKRGVIPIYLSVVLHELKKYAVITRKGIEEELTPQLLKDINNKPNEFQIYIEEWNEDKEQFINELDELFNEYINISEKEYNTFDYIVKAMQRWFLQLPKYTKEYEQKYLGNNKYKKMDKSVIRLRNGLRGAKINSRHFLFNKMFKIFKHKSFTNNVIKDVTKCKEQLDNSLDDLILKLAKDVKEMFENGQKLETTLYSIMKDWYEERNDKTRNHLFSSGEDKFLDLIKNIDNNEIQFIKNLSRITTGLRIEDWQDKNVKEFIDKIKEFKNNIEVYDKKLNNRRTNQTEDNLYKIVSYEKGKKIEKTIEKEKISDTAKDLYEEIEIIMKDYSYTINENEKRQVLLEILNKIC
ncbi:MAG: hypothetical protein FH751_03190 [Firmicutes bacterium]|nr:hypothetical protein [Bacillota bacterium]